MGTGGGIQMTGTFQGEKAPQQSSQRHAYRRNTTRETEEDGGCGVPFQQNIWKDSQLFTWKCL